MKKLEEFIKGWEEFPKNAKFRPFTFFNKDGDALEIYKSDEARVSERINSLLSVFVSEKDPSKVIGVVIKNIRKHFGHQSELNFLVKTGRAKVEVLVRGAQLLQAFAFERKRPAGSESIGLIERAQLVERALQEVGEIEVDLSELELSH